MSLEPKPDFYNTQIIRIQTEFFSILGGYKQKYIDHFMDISNDSAADAYDDCIMQMQIKNQNLHNVAINIQNDIDTNNSNITMTTTQLGAEKLLNNTNSNIFTDIQTTNSGSKIMINDYKTAYNLQYYNNIELFIGVILIIGISSKIFRK
jgi:hypothetical protein